MGLDVPNKQASNGRRVDGSVLEACWKDGTAQGNVEDTHSMSTLPGMEDVKFKPYTVKINITWFNILRCMHLIL